MFHFLLTQSNPPSFYAAGLAALIFMCFLLYLVFAKDSSLYGAIGDTLFRSTGIALLFSALLGFAFWQFVIPTIPTFQFLHFTHRNSSIGLSILPALVLFIVWRMRIKRARIKRRNSITRGV